MHISDLLTVSDLSDDKLAFSYNVCIYTTFLAKQPKSKQSRQVCETKPAQLLIIVFNNVPCACPCN